MPHRSLFLRALWLLPEQPVQRVQESIEMVSAGEGLASAARGPHGGLRPGRGDHDLRVCLPEPLSAHYRVLQATADDAQLRPRSPGRSVPGTPGSPPRSGWLMFPDMP
jgi:hypothetical protein